LKPVPVVVLLDQGKDFRKDYMDGVSLTVEVTAATLYEAVSQGLTAIRGSYHPGIDYSVRKFSPETGAVPVGSVVR
jgi:hypothetical protein